MSSSERAAFSSVTAMTLRDRFYTATTAKALLSWRLAAGAAAAIVVVFTPLHWGLALLIGLAVYAGLVWMAMPRPTRRPEIDPFTVGEPWRQFLIGGQRVRRQLRETVETTPDGPLKERLQLITARLDDGLGQAWQIAKRGDQIDDAIRRLDPTGLRTKLETLERQAEARPSSDLDAAAASVRAQLESADRLKARSAEVSDRLRLVRTQLDELVTRATEVSVGATATDRFDHDVNDVIIEIESLRLALEETHES